MENQIDTQMEQRKGRRLVLFPLPFQGHINPMLLLATILHSKGFSITIIHTNFNSPNPSNFPNFTFHSIPDGFSESEASSKDVVFLAKLLNTKCVEPFRDCMVKLLSDVSEEPISCLISDAFFYFSQAVADSLKLPRVVLRTGGLSSFVVFVAFPLLRERGYLPIQDSQLEEPVVELPPLKVKDLPVIDNVDPDSYYEIIAGMVNESKASAGIIWNSFEELEQSELDTLRQEFPNPIFPIGPFHKYHLTSSSSSLLAQDQSSISWLDKQAPKSVIYASFGSLAALSEAQFLEIAWGLANSNQPFLWVVRPGLIRGSEWLEPLPSGFLETLNGRAHIIKWAPQLEVLAHPAVGAFWTSNGWNSTLESICEGLPMICMPCFTDQKVNAKYVSQVWKVGLQLENGSDRLMIERCIRRLMVEKEGEEIRDRISKLKDKAKFCLQQGGSSLQNLDSLVSHISKLESFVFQSQ
ncbi:UDP-glycosyltransferase 76B1-like [Castanea sativa]|uniref:UDP-glycosyltransferase 76B1-like n=1 Tax=Castanea sativa TaxID=21020 RepID=UPI003F6518D2